MQRETEIRKSEAEIPYFEKIDVIRFAAAIMVVIYHAYQGWVLNGHSLPNLMTESGNGNKLSETGWHIHLFVMNMEFGVELFFLISGFLITYLLLKEKEIGGKIDFKKFFIRRILRIWPLYYFVILISPLLIQLIGQELKPDYLSHILFYSNFDSFLHTEHWVFPLAHFWSLCTEEHFYLIWPFVIAFAPNKQLMKIFVVLILFSIIYRAMVFMNNNSWHELNLSTFSRFDTLVIGSIVALIHFNKPIRLNISKPLRIVLYLFFIAAFSYTSITFWETVYSAGLKKYLYLAMALFMMLNFLFNVAPVWEFLNIKTFRYFGKVSYGIYVYGLILCEIVLKKLIGPLSIDSFHLYLLIIIFLSILIPIISYELFERPILKLKRKFRVIKIQGSD